MTLMILPVIVVLALPPATLGQFSVSKKTTFSALSFSSLYDQITATSPITFLSVAAGQTSNEGARALAKRAGSEVDLIGFVVRYPDTPADEFMLTRYIITCCVSDATIAQVRVVNAVPGQVAADDWIEVKGEIYPIGREVVVTADSLTKVPTPERPYLTP